MIQHKGIIPMAASTAFTMVGRTLALLGVSEHSLIEQTVLADSFLLKVLDFGGNKLATSEYPCNAPKKLILNRSPSNRYTLHNHIKVNLQCESKR